jgi:hypothetical protein
MKLVRLRDVAALLLVGSSLAAGPVRANSASPPASGTRVADVRAGQTVVLTWANIPAAAREIEVLLSVDGGERFTLRATAAVDRARGVVRWRVPNLPTSRARLRLRWGDGASETLAPPTEEFRILADPSAPDAPAPVWDEDDPTTAGPLRDALPGFAARPELVLGQDGALPALTRARPPLPGAPAPDACAAALCAPARSAAPTALPTPRAERRAPQRE